MENSKQTKPRKSGKPQIKKASNFIFFILRCFFKPFLFLRYGLKFKRHKKVKRPCIIISNHATFHDQFIIGCGFRFAMNIVASDSLFRQGVGSSLMKSIARPIPITKGIADVSTVKNIMSVIKQGGAVALFPEGNRTFYGATGYFKPTIGKLAKKLSVPLVIVQMRGGFNTAPRWKHKVSKGKMTVEVTRTIDPEELNALEDTEINDIIEKELYFNEYDYNRTAMVKFRGKRKAEYLETVLFNCPECNSNTGLKSQGNDLFCTACGARVRMNEYGFFDKINKADKLPDNVQTWSEIQLDSIRSADYTPYTDTPIYTDTDTELYTYEAAKRDVLLDSGTLTLYNDRLQLGGTVIPLDEITELTVQGVHKMQIYTHSVMYMVKTLDIRANLMKYMITSYHLKHLNNNEKGEYYGY